MSVDLATLKVGDLIAQGPYDDTPAEIIGVGTDHGLYWVIAQRPGFVPFVVDEGRTSDGWLDRLSDPAIWIKVEPPLIDPQQVWRLAGGRGPLYIDSPHYSGPTDPRIRITAYEVLDPEAAS